MLAFQDFYGSGTALHPSSVETANAAEVPNEQAKTTPQGAVSISWLGMLIVLVALRVLYEVAD